MSTIIGIQTNTCAIIAADSRITSYDGQNITQIHTPNTTKTFNNKHHIGAIAGDLRAINILQNNWTPPKPKKHHTPTQHIHQTLIPHIRTTYETNGYTQNPNATQEAAQTSSTILIAYKAQIFCIDWDYSVMGERNGFYAIGTGSQYALGVLTALYPNAHDLTEQDAKHAATRALNITGHYDPHTGLPYTILTQHAKTLGNTPKP